MITIVRIPTVRRAVSYEQWLYLCLYSGRASTNEPGGSPCGLSTHLLNLDTLSVVSVLYRTRTTLGVVRWPYGPIRQNNSKRFIFIESEQGIRSCPGRMSTLGVDRLVNASIPYARSSRKDSGCCIYRVLGGHGARAEWRDRSRTTHARWRNAESQCGSRVRIRIRWSGPSPGRGEGRTYSDTSMSVAKRLKYPKMESMEEWLKLQGSPDHPEPIRIELYPSGPGHGWSGPPGELGVPWHPPLDSTGRPRPAIYSGI